jgi:hypothetical protein
MARATGRRGLAALCFLVGTLTVIGIPILWPVGYVLWRDAREAEREREQELEALQEVG